MTELQTEALAGESSPKAEPPRAPQCRWCGEGLNVGFSTCPNCHRHQNGLLGRLQVFNAATWLATIGTVVAAVFTFQQVQLAKNDLQQAEQALVQAEQALEKAGRVEASLAQEAEAIRSDLQAAETGVAELKVRTETALTRISAVQRMFEIRISDLRDGRLQASMVIEELQNSSNTAIAEVREETSKAKYELNEAVASIQTTLVRQSQFQLTTAGRRLNVDCPRRRLINDERWSCISAVEHSLLVAISAFELMQEYEGTASHHENFRSQACGVVRYAFDTAMRQNEPVDESEQLIAAYRC